MKVTRRSAGAVKTSKAPVAKKKAAARKASETSFGKSRTQHSKTLDPAPATHTSVPQREIHSASDLRARVAEGQLTRLDHPPRGLDESAGVDIGGDGKGWYAGAHTAQTAFEHGGKVYVKATVWETPGKVWFELGPKPAPVVHQPSKAELHRAELHARVEAGALKRLGAKAPPGLEAAKGVEIGPEPVFQMGGSLMNREVFEQAGKLYVKSTEFETPGKVWFEVVAKPPPVEPKPDPAIALRARVDAGMLMLLSQPPAGLEGQGVSIGGKGYDITERHVYERGGRLFVRATVWEHPSAWFEVK